jgi:hypothetical protein
MMLSDNRERKQYETEELCMAGLALFLLKEGSRNAMNNDRKEIQFLQNYKKMFGLNLPHLDSVDDYFRFLPELELEEVKMKMISTLIRKKVLESAKFRGHYVVAIDGTGVASFDKKHCDCCLTKTSKNGVTTWFHNVLEAKLITPSGLSLSIATEWINNEGKQEYEKQDCEREAFKRIAVKLIENFPRLSIVILADGLYPWQGFFDICQQNNWKYIVTLKDGSLKTLQEEIYWLKLLRPTQNVDMEVNNKNASVSLNYKWLRGLRYRNHTLNFVECLEKTTQIATGQTIEQKFVHLTNFENIDQYCIAVSDTGRLRQKIENEGFNTQKNQGYALEHKFSRVSFTALKNYYQCLQIAHIINQLVEDSKIIDSLLKNNRKFTIKYLWKRLLSFLLEVAIDSFELAELISKPFQIRLI